MSPRLARESDGLLFLFQVYLTASRRKAAAARFPSQHEEQRSAGYPSTALLEGVNP
jgi:hypothetical protein